MRSCFIFVPNLLEILISFNHFAMGEESNSKHIKTQDLFDERLNLIICKNIGLDCIKDIFSRLFGSRIV